MRNIVFAITLFFATPALAAPVQEVKTKAGLTAWLVEEHSQPLIAVNIAFRDSGRAYDPEGKEGRAAMVSALLMEGAGDLDSDAFTIALENSAVKLGFSADDDNFYGNLETLSEQKEKAFSYLGMALQAPRFDEEKIKQIKSQTISAIIDGQNKPAHLLSRAWQKQIFGNHPYAKEELGTKESVEAISVDELREFTRNYLTKKNIVISVVGDISPSELSELLDKNLSALPENYNSAVKIADIKLPEITKQTVMEYDIPQTMVNFGMGGIKRTDPDYIPAFVMNYILGGGGLTSRLALEIREKRGLTYGINTALVPMRHAEIFAGNFSTRNEKVGEAISALKDVLKEYAKNGVSDKELVDAKEYLTGSFVVGLSSNSSIVNFLTMMQLQNLGIDYMERRNNLIRAVTKEQINKIANKIIKIDKLQIVMVGKPKLSENKK